MKIISESLEEGSFGMMVKVVTLEDGSKYQHMEGEQGGNYAKISDPTKTVKPLGKQGLYVRKKDRFNRICFIPFFGWLYFMFGKLENTGQLNMTEMNLGFFLLIHCSSILAIIYILIDLF